MWISDDGRINTVATPDPTDLMTIQFARSSTGVWRRIKPKVRRKWLDELEQEVLIEAMSYDASPREPEFSGATPPPELLTGDPKSLEDLANAVHLVDGRWRVDALMALIDHLDP